jgi:hypoxanthine-DNA glycosylase
MNWTEIKSEIKNELLNRGLANPTIRLNAINSIEKLIDRKFIINIKLLKALDKHDFIWQLEKNKRKPINDAERSIVNNVYDIINGKNINKKKKVSKQVNLGVLDKKISTSEKSNFKKGLKPIIFEDTEILILGTMPGDESLKLNEYYSFANNSFWKIINRIYSPKVFLSDYQNKVALLKANKIGLWDVLLHCERKGSLDSNITEGLVNDFSSFLEKHKKIKAILFNGKDSQRYFFRHFECLDSINYVLMPSTSSSLTKTYEFKLSFWEKELKQ